MDSAGQAFLDRAETSTPQPSRDRRQLVPGAENIRTSSTPDSSAPGRWLEARAPGNIRDRPACGRRCRRWRPARFRPDLKRGTSAVGFTSGTIFKPDGRRDPPLARAEVLCHRRVELSPITPQRSAYVQQGDCGLLPPAASMVLGRRSGVGSIGTLENEAGAGVAAAFVTGNPFADKASSPHMQDLASWGFLVGNSQAVKR